MLYQQLNEYQKWQKDSSVFEFIVVDNSSVENAQQSTLEQNFSWINFIFLKTNEGPSHARNIGLARSKGEFIQFIDDDDLITQEKIEGQLNFLHSNPSIDVVVGATQKDNWSINNLPVKDVNQINFPAFVAVENCSDLTKTEGFFQIGSALFRKKKLLEVKGFDESRWFIEDVDLYLRLFMAGARIVVNKNLPFGLFWRKSNDGSSLSERDRRLFLEGCLVNYLFCVDNALLKTNLDYQVTYTGIYSIINQNILPKSSLYLRGIELLDNLTIIQKINFLPVKSTISILTGFEKFFKISKAFRKIKARIIEHPTRHA